MGNPPALKIILTAAATGLTALLANRSMGIYFNALRPFFPEYVEGRISRNELSAIVFGMSAGSVLGSGIPLALATGIMNGPLLFIAAGMIGCLIAPAWLAVLAGAAWGLGVNLALAAMLKAAGILPFNFLPSLSAIGTPVMTLFSLFPGIAVARQFGRRAGMATFLLALVTRQAVILYAPRFSADAAVLLVSIVCLAVCAVTVKSETAESGGDAPDADVLLRRGRRLRQNLPYLVLTGAVIATLNYLRVFGKSAVSVFALQEGRVADAALADLIDDIGFLPIRITTIMVTGVYSIMGLFGPSLAYLAPNIFAAALIGGAAVVLEATGAFQLGKVVSRFPAIGMVAKHMTAAMTSSLELGLLYGSLLAGDKMAGSAGVFIIVAIYLGNEALGKPISRMAAGPTATLAAGLLLNLLTVLRLFKPA